MDPGVEELTLGHNPQFPQRSHQEDHQDEQHSGLPHALGHHQQGSGKLVHGGEAQQDGGV